MMETGENLSLPENEDHDTKKYKKHVNDLIEDAEIEAEIVLLSNAKGRRAALGSASWDKRFEGTCS